MINYTFFPKEKLENSLRGFSQIPLVKDKDDPSVVKVDLKLTPFGEYENDVVLISNPNFINREMTVEVQSFVLMQHEDRWLKIEDETSDRVGLLINAVNRGIEVQSISSALNSIKLEETSGEKNLAILGYIVEDTRIIFLLRLKFEGLPKFLSKKRRFVDLSSEAYFNLSSYSNLQPFSKKILEYMSDSLLEI